MISRRRMSLIFVGATLAFLLYTLVNQMSTIYPGIGFGRDIQIIIDSNSAYNQLLDFAFLQRYTGREVFMDSISDSIKMLTFSGVNDIQTFMNEIGNKLWNTTVIRVGTFGLLSTLNTFMTSFETYMLAFLFAFIGYWTFRFRFLGFITGIMNAFELVGAILILYHMKNPFTYLVWFTMLICFCLLAFQKKQIIRYVLNENFEHRQSSDSNLTLRLIIQSIVTLLLSFVIYSSEFSLSSSGRYLLIISLLMLVESLIMPFILRLLRYIKSKDAQNMFIFDARKAPSFFSDSNLRMWSRVVVGGLIVMLSVGIVFNTYKDFSKEENSEYTSKTLLLIDEADAQSYIEIHASLATHDLLNDVISYKVSEERALWITFDQSVDHERLELARNDIAKKLAISGSIYEYQGLKNPISSWHFYAVFLISILGSIIIGTTHTSRKYGVLSAVISIVSLVGYLGWGTLFSFESTRMNLLMMLMMPLLTAFFLASSPDEMANMRWNQRLVFSAWSHGVLILLIGVPILLIIPSPGVNAVSMVSLLILWMLSVVTALFIYPLFEKGDRHEVL